MLLKEREITVISFQEYKQVFLNCKISEANNLLIGENWDWETAQTEKDFEEIWGSYTAVWKLGELKLILDGEQG